MAEAAFRSGVRYFGVSNHSHTPNPDDLGGVLPADMTPYRELVMALRRQYEGRMEVLLGLEWDSQSDVSVEGLDYWIGSVHYLLDGETGIYYPVDWDLRYLAQCCVEMFHGNLPALVKRYYEEVAAVAVRRPTILGHFDILTKLNRGEVLFDEDDRRYRDAALEALHAADPERTLLEVNTGAMSRGFRDVPYPAPFLLREWRGMGGRVIITSDAHSADAVVYGYDIAADVIRAAGFQECVLLGRKGRILCPL
jgi:histidinol-phosphatase (PHP family)